ncbi:unnamed protein product [Penicillium bialowiezense]
MPHVDWPSVFSLWIEDIDHGRCVVLVTMKADDWNGMVVATVSAVRMGLHGHACHKKCHAQRAQRKDMGNYVRLINLRVRK